MKMRIDFTNGQRVEYEHVNLSYLLEILKEFEEKVLTLAIKEVRIASEL